jgi:uncharacterized protein YprB with RNaseH-like and TPR domain
MRERLAEVLRARTDDRDAPARRVGPRSLEEFLPGVEIVGERGACWAGRWEFDDGALEAGEVVAELGAAARAATHDHLLLLDLETTGFSGTPLFLAGLIEVEPGAGAPRIAQLFARDYSEEAAVIEAVAARLARRPVLVTFNGKSYDLPFLRDRAARHRMRLPEPGGHVDLLHAARRRWRGILPNCRLTTLEAHMAGGERYGARLADVAGVEIPSRYHDAVRRADPSGLFGVFLHNALDLVTLARLYVALRIEAPHESREPKRVRRRALGR